MLSQALSPLILPFDSLLPSLTIGPLAGTQLSAAVASVFQFFVNDFGLYPLLELCYVLLINGSVGLIHARVAAPKHFSWQSSTSKRWLNQSILALHIVAGMTEILRWHLSAIVRQSPAADRLDVALCLIQAMTNLALVKWMTRGYPIMTRPSYQAGAFLRPALTLAAWACARPDLHRASIKALNAFGYARLLIHFLGPLIKTRNEDTAQGKHKYNIAILLAALLAVSESGFQYAVPFYVLMVVLIAWLNRWTTEEISSKKVKPLSKRMFVLVCGFAGLMEIAGLRRMPGAEQPRPYDVYADPNEEEIKEKLL